VLFLVFEHFDQKHEIKLGDGISYACCKASRTAIRNIISEAKKNSAAISAVVRNVSAIFCEHVKFDSEWVGNFKQHVYDSFDVKLADAIKDFDAA
jgi:hypothetical protein